MVNFVARYAYENQISLMKITEIYSLHSLHSPEEVRMQMVVDRPGESRAEGRNVGSMVGWRRSARVGRRVISPSGSL